MASYFLDPVAEDELDEIWGRIAENNPAVASRVMLAAHASFELLANNPHIGRVKALPDTQLKDIRVWYVAGYEQYLIFYRVVPGGIQVIHVYHAARDIERMLGGDEA